VSWRHDLWPAAWSRHQGALESERNYRYPWGSDHNGTARMYASATDHNRVSLSGGVLTLKATRISWDEGNSGAVPHLPIRCHSSAERLHRTDAGVKRESVRV
jgi:hypothetical protein